MKKFNCLYILMLFTVFIPKVYAFTYDIETNVDATSVVEGTVKEIRVSLKNVQGVDGGFGACSLKIQLDSNISFNGDVRALDGWTVMSGDVYAVDTSSSFVNNSEMLIIPVKINNAGSVRLTNIECSDGETKETIADKTVSFEIKKNTNSETSNNNSGNNETNDEDTTEKNYSSTDLIDIKLSEGTIDFDPSITEYTIRVSDFNALEVTPVLADESSLYVVDDSIIQNGGPSVLITVQAQDGDVKTYVIYVEEETVQEKEDNNGNNKYVPIFIGIICVLVLINIFRIVRNLKK